MNWAVVKKALFDWVSGVTGVTVVWEDQEAGRPAYPFITLNVDSVVSIGVDETIHEYNDETDQLDTTVRGNRRFTLRVEAFSDSNTPGGTAQQYIEALVARLRLNASREAFAAANIGFISHNGPLDVGRVIDQKNEDRWGIDIQFAGSLNLTDSGGTGIIESVGIKMMLEDKEVDLGDIVG